jgi:hypothetical protein
VGKYKGDPGPDISISLANGRLSAVVVGQRPFALIPVDQTTFRPAAFDGITITFQIEAGKATGFALKQGPTTTQLKRVEEAKQP